MILVFKTPRHPDETLDGNCC